MYNVFMILKPRNIFFILWNTSIIIFSLALIISNLLDSEVADEVILKVVIYAVISGIFYFLCFCFFYISDLVSKKIEFKLNNLQYGIIPVFFLLVGLTGSILTEDIKDNSKELASIQEQIEQINTEKVNSGELSNTQRVFNTQPVVNTTPPVQDTDPIIDCKNDKCGTIRIRRSACNVSVCCELEDGWVRVNSETECRNAQNAEYEEQVEYWKDYWEDYYDKKDKDDDYDLPEFPPLEPLPSIDMTIPDYSTDTPVIDTAEEIKKCEDRAREDTKSQIDGCYVKYEGSAANMCAKGYQDLGAKAITSCRNMY